MAIYINTIKTQNPKKEIPKPPRHLNSRTLTRFYRHAARFSLKKHLISKARGNARAEKVHISAGISQQTLGENGRDRGSHRGE